MKKTKIICTAGPACNDYDILLDMAKNGMDVIRINLSHATHSFAEEIVSKIRKINKEFDFNIGILFDTKGPEVRVGKFKDGFIKLESGEEVILTPKEVSGDDYKINISERNLYLDLDIDSTILIDNGNIELKVIGINNEDIMARVIHGGILKDNKNINVKDVDLSVDFLSIADKNDILFASKLNADFISLSFVRSANDILDVNDMLIADKNEHTQIISKIENKSALEDLDNIIKVSDGIIVARGDLGVEIELTKLPCVAKDIIKRSKDKNKICIVSTDMLSSMEEKEKPTRSEVCDIASFIFDGVDAFTLSGETAIGKYPVLSTKVMSDIIKETEAHVDYKQELKCINNKNVDNTTVLAYTASNISNTIDIKAIIVFTVSGYTARKLSNYKPNCPVIAVVSEKEAAKSLSLNFGIKSVVSKKFNNADDIMELGLKVAKENLDLNREDKIIIMGGFPTRKSRSTNFIKIEEI